ncbi:MAG: shikimate dehydrogenase [Actinomycetota bacterium]|nr:shikimate dehydrogenase [Actinomycetota bacterium]MDP2288530.1 shikimate dehydrogenase [Actinomycetota bacterium]
MKRAAVLGSPIAHSLSPALHRAAYAALGLDWTYDAIEVDESELAHFLAQLDDSWAGLSLTMPLKEVAIELCELVDPTALSIRSVNTLLPTATGWSGTNTDVTGIVRSLEEIGLGSDLDSALILGAGATARSGIAALAQMRVGSVGVAARRPEQVAELLELAESLGLSASAVAWEPKPSSLDVSLVLSSLPGDAGAPWAQVAGSTSAALLDVAYHPWPTPLAAAWPTTQIASGRSMLLWQAVEQVRLMTGLDGPVDAMRASLN